MASKSRIPSAQPKKQATLQSMSDAATTRTRAASRTSRSRTRKVNSTFGADLTNVFSFDAPEEKE